MTNAIEIKNLSKKYKTFTLNDINLTLPTGTIMGLVGGNGAGKSTTINLILNYIKATTGEVFVLGQRNTDENFYKVKNDIGVVFDECKFPVSFNIKKLNSVFKNAYENWEEETFFSYCKRFDLPEKTNIKSYSKGMKMKISIAVALSHQAKLLILDEPTSGLDPMIREEILDVFNEFTRDENNSILISSHIVSDLEKICDYIAFINKGSLLLCEEKDKLLEKYAILKTDQAEDIPSEAIILKKSDTEYFVNKELISSAFITEKTTLEDIIISFSKVEV